MTTVLLNLHNAGLIPLSSMILAMGLCYGGLGQVIAGVMEWKKRNTFGTLAFTSYGLFWISLAFMLLLPRMGWAAAPDKASVGAYLLLWGCFTFLMFFGTLRTNKALMTVFGSLTILFWLLAAGDLSGEELQNEKLVTRDSWPVTRDPITMKLLPARQSLVRRRVLCLLSSFLHPQFFSESCHDLFGHLCIIVIFCILFGPIDCRLPECGGHLVQHLLRAVSPLHGEGNACRCFF